VTDTGPWTKYQDAAAAPAAAPAEGEGPWTKYQAKGFLGKVVDAGKAAVSAVVGENEFDYPEITSSDSHLFKENYQVIPRLNMARGEDGMLDVLKKAYPQMPSPSKDKFGNVIVSIDDKPYYLNKSGVSKRDVDEFARDTLITMPFGGAAARVAGAAALPIRAAAQAFAGGAGSLAVDAASSAAGSEQGIDIPAFLASALGGAGGEAAGSAIGSLINVVRTNPSKYVAGGKLTDEGQRIFAAAGFDPEEISTRVANEFARRARSTGANEATAREVAANEFNIPLTRGQATADYDQIAFENAAARGARGEMAGDIMRGRMDRQHQAIESAKTGVIDDIAPVPGVNSPQEAAGSVLSGVRNRETAHGKMEDATWDQARDLAKGAAVPKDSIKQLPQVGRDALRADPRLYTPDDDATLYPAARAALKLLDRWGSLDIGEMSTKSGKAVGPLGVSLEMVDELRKMISGKGGLIDSAVTSADKLRVRAIDSAVKGWLDDVADNELMSGKFGPEAVEQFKRARAASAKHFSTFGKRDAQDEAGAVIERMIERDVTEQEVANFLFGSSKVGESGRAYRVIKRIGEMSGKDSDEYDAIRRGMWLKVVSEAEGKTQPGAQAVAENVFEFVNGKGRAIAEELYTSQEIAKMRRFAATLKNTVPPTGTVNHSNSGYEVARGLGDIFNVNAPFYIRIFGLAGNAKNALRAAGGGAPPTRSSAGAALPSAAAVGSERYLTSDQE
jgi:hypothetical protein